MAGPIATSPEFWIKADTGIFSDAGSTPITTTGGRLRQWNDQSGNGWHSSQSDFDSRPFCDIFGGQGFVRGGVISTFMGNAYDGNGMPMTMAVAFQRKADAGGTIRGLVTFDKPGAAGQSVGWSGSNQLQVEVKDGTAFYTSGSTLPGDILHLAIVEWTGAAPGSANVTARLNGSIEINQNYTSGTLDNGSGGFLYTYDGSAGFCADAFIYEAFVWEAGIDGTDRAAITTYFQQRFSDFRRYLLPVFPGDGPDEVLRLLTSDDGETFVERSCTLTPATGSVRDPQYLYTDSKHWIAHTTGAFGASDSFGVAMSTGPGNGLNYAFTTVHDVDCSSISGGVDQVFGAKWFLDPNDSNSIHILLAASVDGGTSFQQYEVHPTNIGMTTWSTPVAITGTSLPTNMIDAFEFFYSGTYYILVKDETTKFIILLSSSSPFSGFTVLKSGDWMGIDQAEGCSIVNMGSFWRVYYDDYLNHDGGGIHFVDASSLNLNTATWGSPTAIAAEITTRNGGIYDTEAVVGIAFDAASNSGYQAAQSTYSWSHTNNGNFLAVDVGLLSAGQTVTGITYAGVALSLIGAQSTVTSFGRIEQWGLVAPATGSNTIAVTLSGSIASAATAVSYTGVHQTSPTEAFNSAQATNVGAADATVNITTVADNCWVHGAIATDDASVTANQTSRNNVTGALGSGANEDTGPKTPAGSVAISYTGVAALATWAIAGYGVRPVAASTLASGPVSRSRFVRQAVNRASTY